VELELHPQVVREARAIRLWYRRRSPAAAIGFIAELDRAVDAILRGPDVYAEYLHGTRRYVMQRYPFSVIFRSRPSSILVVAIAHSKKRPGYWWRRR
jgi:toxin ParE1/3/4